MRIYSIFQSVDGEVNSRGIGAMTVFIRMAGCLANCPFCDSAYAKDPDSGTEMTVEEIMREVSPYNCNNVTITGGEPLEQMDDLEELLTVLLDNQYNVSVETNGLHYFSKDVFPFSCVDWVVDIKTFGPSYISIYKNMQLDRTDYLKMVVGSREQFKDAMGRKLQLQEHGVQATFAYSPEYGKVEPDELLGWMKEFKQMDAVLNCQMHKILHLTEAK